jgi:hypothetical protein
MAARDIDFEDREIQPRVPLNDLRLLLALPIVLDPLPPSAPYDPLPKDALITSSSIHTFLTPRYPRGFPPLRVDLPRVIGFAANAARHARTRIRQGWYWQSRARPFDPYIFLAPRHPRGFPPPCVDLPCGPRVTGLAANAARHARTRISQGCIGRSELGRGSCHPSCTTSLTLRPRVEPVAFSIDYPSLLTSQLPRARILAPLHSASVLRLAPHHVHPSGFDANASIFACVP